jgi:hypothetical protein
MTQMREGQATGRHTAVLGTRAVLTSAITNARASSAGRDCVGDRLAEFSEIAPRAQQGQALGHGPGHQMAEPSEVQASAADLVSVVVVEEHVPDDLIERSSRLIVGFALATSTRGSE